MTETKLPTGTATIGLLDGSVRRGRLARFAPLEPDVTLEMAPLPVPQDGGHPRPPRPPAREILHAEAIAYIAWHRDPEERLNAVDVAYVRYKVHVAGKRTFVVDVRPAETKGPVGFTAFPAQLDGDYKQLFFYHHGVAAREKDEPLGAMLVREGVLGAAALDSAVAHQRASRAVPIGQILVELHRVSQSDVERAAALQERRKLRIGEVLVEAGLATRADIDAALAEQKQRRGRRLGEVLVGMGVVSEDALARTLAKKFDLPFVDLDVCAVNPAAATAVPREIIEKYGLLPLDADDKTLTVAISDPLALEALDLLRFHTKLRLQEVLVTAAQLARYVAACVQRLDAAAERDKEPLQAIMKQLSAAEVGADTGDDDDDGPREVSSDSGIVNLVNQIIADAYRRGASDIHVEPNGKEQPTAVRFRVDGDCVKYQDVPAAHRASLVARIKVMAKLDISERRKPQDGKIKFRLGDRQIELRVATIPTSRGGEDVVLRILAGSKPLPLEKMRLSERNLRELRRIVEQPYGLILCVGPTGSGKTTTLHSALGAINTPDRKIWTAEDPVEITQDGLRQVQVNARIGFTFAQAMRAFLRADPDVIMVGEMRDAETAGTAIEASLTGHLVFSTLHTNSAPETVTRLLDMGLDPFSFADALLGVLAQRLARSLCAKCKRSHAPSATEREQLVRAYGEEELAHDFGVTPADLRVWKGAGCDACGGTGYKGRIALHELLATDDATKRAIAKKAPVDEVRALARAGGMRTLLQDGVAKALAGETDLAQVLAVCSA